MRESRKNWKGAERGGGGLDKLFFLSALLFFYHSYTGLKGYVLMN